MCYSLALNCNTIAVEFCNLKPGLQPHLVLSRNGVEQTNILTFVTVWCMMEVT